MEKLIVLQKVTSIPPTGQTTARDVAKLAGVTQTTVSRVINSPHLVALETRQKVEQAISSLRYRPFTLARSLAKGRNNVIGLITPVETFSADILGLIVEGVSRVLTAHNFLLNIESLPPTSKREDLERCPLIRQNSCDGILFNIPSHAPKDLVLFLQNLNIPYIVINSPVELPYNCVMPSDQDATEKAVAYLISKGHRRIAYLTGSGAGHISSLKARERGYEIAMYRAGLTPIPLFNVGLTSSDLQISEAQRHQNRLDEINHRLDFWFADPNPPTAILTYNANFSTFVARAAYLRRWFIPEKFSIMSCDDEILIQRGILPITAMNLNRTQISIEATEMLLQKITNPEKQFPTKYVDCVLQERMSVATLHTT